MFFLRENTLFCFNTSLISEASYICSVFMPTMSQTISYIIGSTESGLDNISRVIDLPWKFQHEFGACSHQLKNAFTVGRILESLSFDVGQSIVC